MSVEKKRIQNAVDAYIKLHMDGSVSVNKLIGMLRSICPKEYGDEILVRNGEHLPMVENPNRFPKKTKSQTKPHSKSAAKPNGLKKKSLQEYIFLFIQRAPNGATSSEASKALKLETDRVCQNLCLLEDKGLVKKSPVKAKDRVPSGPKFVYRAVLQ